MFKITTVQLPISDGRLPELPADSRLTHYKDVYFFFTNLFSALWWGVGVVVRQRPVSSRQAAAPVI